MPEEIENHIPKIGAFVLETLTTGMYTNPLDTLREFIQNSFDSIKSAEREKLFREGGGRIHISIDKKARTIKIRDNGIGIPESETFDRLINVGMSGKSIERDAGFRGIGRLAGIAYCENLIFRTKAKDEKTISEIKFDCVGLKKAMSPQMRQVEELFEVLRRYSEVSYSKGNMSDHFFEVILNSVCPAAEIFLEWLNIERYLSQNAPVGFDTQSFALAGEIYKWLEDRKIKIPKVNLILSSESKAVEVFKPYKKLTYKTARDNLKIHVSGIKFYPENLGPDSPFWIWYSNSNLPGMFGDDRVGGLRLRKNNIAIGTADRMSEIFAEVAESNARFNFYLMGEVHIQSNNVIPNARRDGFEDNLEWQDIKRQLQVISK